MPTTGDLALLLERFWAAGFFDGEGCASVSEVARPGEPSLRTADLAGPTPKHELAIKQGYGEMGHENLKRFQAAVGGVGRISEPQPGGGNSADYRVWRVTDEKDVAIVFRAIAPFVGPQKYADLVTALNVSALRDMRSVMLGTRRKGASPGSIASFPPE
jgi:hypothetical protein